VNFTAAAKFDMLPISKEAIVELVAGYSEEQIKAMAERVAKKIGTDMAFQMRGRYDFEAVVDVFDYLHKASDSPYKHTVDERNNNRHTFIVQFGMGRKWSIAISEFWKVIFEPVSTKKVECTVTDNMIAITVEGGSGNISQDSTYTS
jgi:hypothetical protein